MKMSWKKIGFAALSAAITAAITAAVNLFTNKSKTKTQTQAALEIEAAKLENAKKLEEKKTEERKKRLEDEENHRCKMNEIAEEQRRKNELAAQRAAEEQRRKAEAAALAAQKERQEIEALVQKGIAALSSGDIARAEEYFKAAEKRLSASQSANGNSSPLVQTDGSKDLQKQGGSASHGEQPAVPFTAAKESQMADALFTAAQNSESKEEKRRLSDQAAALAEKAIAQNEDDAQSQFIVGMNSLEKRDYRKAYAHLSKAVETDMTNAFYYYNLGRSQFMMKKYDAAEASFARSCELDANFIPSRYNLGLTKLRRDNLDGALSDFQKVHALDKNHENSYLEEARTYSKKGDSEHALRSYAEVLRINPRNCAALNESGVICMAQKDFSGAEAFFAKSAALLRSGEEKTITLYNLSTAQAEQQKLSEALETAKTAYDMRDQTDEKSRTNITYNYAFLLEKTGAAEEAIGLYSEVLSENPRHKKSLVNLGALYMGRTPPEPDAALSLLRTAFEEEPESFEVNNNLGSAYFAKQEWKSAMTHFENAVRAEPDNVEAKTNLAQAYSRGGELEKADSTFREILKTEPENWDALIELGKVCIARSDGDSAAKYLEYVQIKNPDYRAAEVSALLESVR